ncbi:MAG TPA: acyl-CoA synthetase [Accumulibacter sp.]|nr:acyl-CoA synthetase [Accumulibacter sp.]HMW18091.1 acyl-CoA synthetase [Accumulibacter sp.]HMX23807.1 acyl-CoA synthetase [Accumulibacter sp.]HMY07107.1 acyl-CoA synthetase [Accumulibacter sp.]HNC17187.1 acyl-CoA synthetase [Accumulibacter sp.]
MNGDPRPAAQWMARQERSNRSILRLMVWISLHFGRRIGRVVLYGIALYFTLFSPDARRAGRNYLRRVLGREPTWSDGYRHVLSFASTIHDRVYLLNDRFELFDITIEGGDAVHAALAEPGGALLIGGHLGSFEVMRAIGRGLAGLKVAMLMYEENARKLNATLEAINPAARQDIIALGRVDSMLAVQERLTQGYLVGILADRGLSNEATVTLPFLGEPAPFPSGPFRLAAMLRRPVLFMTGLYLGGNRYRVHFEPLIDFSAIPPGERQQAMREAQARYVARLEHHCRQAPYNWFNFFDFWHPEK